MHRARARVTGSRLTLLFGLGVVAGCGKVEGTARDGMPPPIDSALADGTNTPDAGPPPRFVRVFYTASQGPATAIQAVDINDGIAGAPVALNLPATNTMVNVGTFIVDAAGNTLLYVADGEVDERPEAYVVRFSDSGPQQPIRISHDHGTGHVLDILISDDGRRAVYSWGTSSQSGSTRTQYYAVNLGSAVPGDPVPLTGGRSIGNGTLSADGKRFAFTEGDAIYVVDLSGTTPSAPVRASGDGVSGSGVLPPIFSPTGKTLAYVSDAITNDVYELFVVDVSSSTPSRPERASGALAAGQQVAFGLFGGPMQQFSHDGKKLGYLTKGNGPIDLYVVDVSGPAPGNAHKVNNSIPGGIVGDDPLLLMTPFAFSPDGRYVGFIGDVRINDQIEAFVADITGATPAVAQRVSGAMPAGGDATRFEFAPDGSGLVYLADQRTDEVQEIFYVNLRNAAPSVAHVVNSNFAAGGDIFTTGFNTGAFFSRNGRRIAYVADQNIDNKIELFLSDVSSGDPTPPLPVENSTNPRNVVASVRFSADSSIAIWSSTASGVAELWYSDLSGETPTEPRKVNTNSPVGSFVTAP